MPRARRRARRGQPPSFTTACGSAVTTATPAAGRYIRSVYSWSIRVVEKRHSEAAIERRIVSTHADGSPRSVILHLNTTSTGGSVPPGNAGARLACVTVPF